jgi:hypothetical protein
MIPPAPSKTAVAAFVLALIIAALLTPDLRQLAERHGPLDQLFYAKISVDVTGSWPAGTQCGNWP